MKNIDEDHLEVTTTTDGEFYVTSRCIEEYSSDDGDELYVITKPLIKKWFDDNIENFRSLATEMLTNYSGRELLRKKMERVMDAFFKAPVLYDFHRSHYNGWIEACCNTVYPKFRA